MAIRIKKATNDERFDYAHIGGRKTYPLWGWAWMENGTKLAVEDLRSWPKEDPQYEVMAPDGYHFAYDMTHTLLCQNQADIKERLGYLRLWKCTEDCWGTGPRVTEPVVAADVEVTQ